MQKTELEALLARVEAATGPDRELDCRLEAVLVHKNCFVEVGPPTYDPPRYFCNPNLAINWIGYDLLNNSPRYTASIDAAVALVERVLPGWRVCMSVGQDYSKTQFIRGWGAKTEHISGALTERPDNELPLCIIAALLRALISEKTDA